MTPFPTRPTFSSPLESNPNSYKTDYITSVTRLGEILPFGYFLLEHFHHKIKQAEAVFFVVCDPSINEL